MARCRIERVGECMPPYDIITTQFVSPEVGKDNSKRFILSWTRTCSGQLSGRALARKAKGPGSNPGPGQNFSLSI